MMILATACLGHVGLLLLLFNGVDTVRRPLAREPEPLRLTLLDSFVRPEPPDRRPSPAPELVPPTHVIVPLPQIESAPSGTALYAPVSDSVPQVDWIGERQREVVAVVTRESGGTAPSAGWSDDRCAHAGEAVTTRAPRSCTHSRAGARIGR